jgi:hypothetical protein
MRRLCLLPLPAASVCSRCYAPPPPPCRHPPCAPPPPAAFGSDPRRRMLLFLKAAMDRRHAPLQCHHLRLRQSFSPAIVSVFPFFWPPRRLAPFRQICSGQRQRQQQRLTRCASMECPVMPDSGTTLPVLLSPRSSALPYFHAHTPTCNRTSTTPAMMLAMRCPAITVAVVPDGLPSDTVVPD